MALSGYALVQGYDVVAEITRPKNFDHLSLFVEPQDLDRRFERFFAVLIRTGFVRVQVDLVPCFLKGCKPMFFLKILRPLLRPIVIIQCGVVAFRKNRAVQVSNDNLVDVGGPDGNDFVALFVQGEN